MPRHWPPQKGDLCEIPMFCIVLLEIPAAQVLLHVTVHFRQIESIWIVEEVIAVQTKQNCFQTKPNNQNCFSSRCPMFALRIPKICARGCPCSHSWCWKSFKPTGKTFETLTIKNLTPRTQLQFFCCLITRCRNEWSMRSTDIIGTHARKENVITRSKRRRTFRITAFFQIKNARTRWFHKNPDAWKCAMLNCKWSVSGGMVSSEESNVMSALSAQAQIQSGSTRWCMDMQGIVAV